MTSKQIQCGSIIMYDHDDDHYVCLIVSIEDRKEKYPSMKNGELNIINCVNNHGKLASFLQDTILKEYELLNES